MKRFIQQLLSVQVYRGEFPVLHSSSSAIDTVHWIAIFLSWDCVTGRKIHNHLNPVDKILWASPWGQWFVVHTHTENCLNIPGYTEKKTTLHTTVHHSDINSIRSLVSGCNYTFRGWPTLALQSYVIIHMRWKGQQHKGRSSTAYLTGVKLWISN